MSGYAVNVLLGFGPGGVSDEATAEAATLEDLLERVRQAVTERPDFRAITVVHIEDLPILMQGAQPDGRR